MHTLVKIVPNMCEKSRWGVCSLEHLNLVILELRRVFSFIGKFS